VNSLAKEITCRKSSAAWTRTCNLQITSRELGYTTRPNTPQTWELCLSNQLQLSRLPTRTEIARRAVSKVAPTVWNELLLNILLRIHLATSELWPHYYRFAFLWCAPHSKSASIHILTSHLYVVNLSLWCHQQLLHDARTCVLIWVDLHVKIWDFCMPYLSLIPCHLPVCWLVTIVTWWYL